MRAIFVDTWYLIARFNRYDSDHGRALRIDARLRGEVLVTHDSVLVEMLTFFADYGSFFRAGAARNVRDALEGGRFEVVPMDRELFTRALDLYAGRLDKEYSLVDCMSMVVMRDRGITHVLTNDHHFRQEGFTVVSE